MNAAKYVYYDQENNEFIAAFKGYQGVGATEKEAIKNLERELRNSPVNTRRRRGW